jgi:hypothetical protein
MNQNESLAKKIFNGVHMIVVTVLSPFLYLYYKLRLQKRELLCQKNSSYLGSGPHIAIIIADRFTSNYSFLTKVFNIHNKLVYSDDIVKLKEYIRIKLKRPFKVYKSVTPDSFKKIVLSKKAHSLFIFGHGSKTKLGFGRFPSKFVDYSELRNAPKKRFIAQYHCNSGDNTIVEWFNCFFGKICKIDYDRGDSLRKLLGARGFDKDGLLTAADINEHIAKICKGQIRI